MATNTSRDVNILKQEVACRKPLAAVGAENPNVRRIKTTLKTLGEVKEKLIRSHVIYLAYVKSNVANPDHSNFVKKIQQTQPSS